jgi:hypothetical protein
MENVATRSNLWWNNKKNCLLLIMVLASFSGMGQALSFGTLGGGFTLGGGVRSMFYDTLDKKLYVSGQFQKADGKLVWGVAVWYNNQWDSLQGGLTQFPHQPSDPNEWASFAHKIIRFQNKIYFVGAITWVNGKNQYNMGVWDLTSNSWDYPISQPPNDRIYDLKVHNNTLYACGKFTKFGNTVCNYVAKFDGLSWQPVGDFTKFEKRASGPTQIGPIEIYKGDIYVGGAFDGPDGIPQNIAKYDGTEWVQVSTGIKQGGIAWVECLETFNDKLYIGGYFVRSTEVPGNGFITWDGNSFAPALSFDLSGSGFVKTLKKHKNRLYVMGKFQEIGPYPAIGFFYLDAEKQCAVDGLSSIWTNTANINWERCEFIEDSLIIGGYYKYLDTVEVNNIGVIKNFENNSSCLITGIHESFFDNIGLRVYPNPVKESITVEIENLPSESLKITLFNVQGQQVFSLDTTIGEKQSIDLRGFPAGLYFLKIQGYSGQKTIKILKE